MNKLYGSFIFFFYFVKYPIVIGLPIAYALLEYPNNMIMNIIWLICSILILKDWFMPKKQKKEG